MTKGKKILLYSTVSILGLYFLFLGLSKVKPFLAPLAVAMILALLVVPLSRKMESSFLNRTAASIINTILLFLISLGFFALLSMQVKNLVDDWPLIKETMEPKVEQLKEFVFEHTALTQEDFDRSATAKTTIPFFDPAENPGQKAVGFFNSSMRFIFTYILTFIYIFFMLNYRAHFKKFLLRLFPDSKRKKVTTIISESTRVTQKYLLGKLMLVGFLAIFYSIGLGISGVRNFILVSVLAAIFSIIPYIGNIIGFGMALVFGYLTSGNPGVLIGISLTFFIGQFIESYILNPYVVGDQVDLHPFLVILVVVVGNFTWGIVGMILSIPVLAIVNIILLNVKPLRPFGYLFSKEGKVK